MNTPRPTPNRLAARIALGPLLLAVASLTGCAATSETQLSWDSLGGTTAQDGNAYLSCVDGRLTPAPPPSSATAALPASCSPAVPIRCRPAESCR
ncbi:MAG: hypothetical protein QM805_23935 [Pseudomonas sp.]